MDQIQEPEHYKTGNTECIELMKNMATEEEFEGFLRLTAFKYLYRYNNKGNAQQDLDKASQYIKALKNVKKYPECVNVFKPATKMFESTANQKGPDREPNFEELIGDPYEGDLTPDPDMNVDVPFTVDDLYDAHYVGDESETEEVMKEVTIVFGDSLRDCHQFVEEHREAFDEIEEFNDPIMMWRETQLDQFLTNQDGDIKINVFPTS